MVADGLVDPLARDVGDLALQLDVEGDRLGLDPLLQARRANLDRSLADLDFLLRARQKRKTALAVVFVAFASGFVVIDDQYMSGIVH